MKKFKQEYFTLAFLVLIIVYFFMEHNSVKHFNDSPHGSKAVRIGKPSEYMPLFLNDIFSDYAVYIDAGNFPEIINHLMSVKHKLGHLSIKNITLTNRQISSLKQFKSLTFLSFYNVTTDTGVINIKLRDKEVWSYLD